MTIRKYFKTLLLAALFFLCSLAAVMAAAGMRGEDHPKRAAFEQRCSMAARMRHYGTPGVALAVFRAQGLDWSAGYGLTTPGGQAVSGQTVFQAASVSKVVAAVCALRMAVAGNPPLDGEVNNWLCSWKLPQRFGSPVPSVRLRELLSHTAGVNVPGFPGYARRVQPPTLLQVLRGAPPAVTPPVAVTLYPGSVFHYSGGGYSVLQQLLEDAGGKAYGDLVHELVFTVCGMQRSGFMASEGNHVALAHDARGFPVPGGWRVYPELAAAGMWSTAEDLARLGRALCLASQGQAGGVLPPTLARMMFRPQVRDGELGMGLGVFVKVGQEDVVFHEGSNQGYKCLLLMLPQRCEGLAVMTNAENGRGLIMEMLQAVAMVYGWPGLVQEEPSGVTSPGSVASYGEDWQGLWQDAYGGRIGILEHAGRLSVELFEDMTPAPLQAITSGPQAPGLLLADPLVPMVLQRQGEALIVKRRLFGAQRARRVKDVH